jgi:hypothetical protein
MPTGGWGDSESNVEKRYDVPSPRLVKAVDATSGTGVVIVLNAEAGEDAATLQTQVKGWFDDAKYAVDLHPDRTKNGDAGLRVDSLTKHGKVVAEVLDILKNRSQIDVIDQSAALRVLAPDYKPQRDSSTTR